MPSYVFSTWADLRETEPLYGPARFTIVSSSFWSDVHDAVLLDAPSFDKFSRLFPFFSIR